MRTVKMIAVAVVLIAIAITLPLAAVQAQSRYSVPPLSLLRNPGFELGSGNSASDWQTEIVGGSPSTVSFQRTTGPHSGQYCARLTLNSEGIARWYQTVTLEADTLYELSGWVRTQGVEDGFCGAKIAVIGIGTYLGCNTESQTGTKGWTYVSTQFISGPYPNGQAKIVASIGDKDDLYVKNTSSGTAWFDDLKLVKLRQMPRVTLTGKHVTISIYAEDCLFNNPQQYLGYLDEVYESMADLVGKMPYNGEKIVVRSDASMYYMGLSGNPISIGPGHGYWGWATTVNRNGMDFGVPHELGHDFDLAFPDQYWGLYIGNAAYDGFEHWANFKAIYALERLGQRHPQLNVAVLDREFIPLTHLGQAFIDKSLVPWAQSGRKDYWNMGNDAYTSILYQLTQRFGWEPSKQAFRAYSAMAFQTPIPTTDEGKVQLWAQTLSRVSGIDFIPYFKSWGFPVVAY